MSMIPIHNYNLYIPLIRVCFTDSPIVSTTARSVKRHEHQVEVAARTSSLKNATITSV